jgi:hypothetical protein
MQGLNMHEGQFEGHSQKTDIPSSSLHPLLSALKYFRELLAFSSLSIVSITITMQPFNATCCVGMNAA